MYKKLITFIALMLLAGTPVYGATNTCGQVKVDNSCSDMTGYELYTCRLKSICSLCKPRKMLYNSEQSDEQKYLLLETGDEQYLIKNQQKYRENMNNLYACALIQSQKNALTRLKDYDSDIKVKDKIETRINQRLKNLSRKENSIPCTGIEETDSFNKLAVLNQSSYEICKYLSYLDYLDYYTDSLPNIQSEDTTVTALAAKQINAKADIADEFDNSIKIFPLAFTAYSQYENYVAIHFMLEIIREDFIIFRKRLQQVLLPLNQALYKAHNSMQRD